MSLVCGVDAGQSATRALLVAAAGTDAQRVLGTGRAAGVIHTSSAAGVQRFVTAVIGALDAALAAAGPAAHMPRALVIGASGIAAGHAPEAQTARAAVTRALARRGHRVAVDVTSDAHTALFGAHNGGPGIIAIAGTGSIVLGRNAAGAEVRIGGWGWLIDDAGSAFAIGRDGLRAAVRAADGTGPATTLEAAMRTVMQVDHLFDLKHRVYAADFGARGFAALAPLVAAAAQDGDPVARAIMQAAAAALADAIHAAAAQLESPDASLSVVLHGGAFDHLAGLRTEVTQRLTVPVLPARMSPLAAAAAMAGKLTIDG